MRSGAPRVTKRYYPRPTPEHKRYRRGPVGDPPRGCYGSGVNKIIREVLVLLWKAFRLVLWKWLRPLLGQVVLYSVLLVGLVVLLVVFATRL